jgi:hypothetical protein
VINDWIWKLYTIVEPIRLTMAAGFARSWRYYKTDVLALPAGIFIVNFSVGMILSGFYLEGIMFLILSVIATLTLIRNIYIRGERELLERKRTIDLDLEVIDVR